MFRTLCAFLLLASPALGITITEDTTLTSADVFPRGEGVNVAAGVTLTIDGAEIWKLSSSGKVIVLPGSVIHETRLQNDATWDIRGGDWYAFPQAYNGNFLISGGTFHERIQFWDGTYEHGTLDISGGTFLNTISFSSPEEPSGDFHVTVRGGEWLGGGVSMKYGKATLEVFGRYLYRDDDATWQRVRGILPNGSPFSGGSSDSSDGVITMHSDLSSVIPGDANADGSVDLDDLNSVRNYFGRNSGGPFGGDADFDRDVDLDDLNLVRNNFGATSNPVPEPASLALLFTAVPMCLLLARYTSRPRRQR